MDVKNAKIEKWYRENLEKYINQREAGFDECAFKGAYSESMGASRIENNGRLGDPYIYDLKFQMERFKKNLDFVPENKREEAEKMYKLYEKISNMFIDNSMETTFYRDVSTQEKIDPNLSDKERKEYANYVLSSMFGNQIDQYHTNLKNLLQTVSSVYETKYSIDPRAKGVLTDEEYKEGTHAGFISCPRESFQDLIKFAEENDIHGITMDMLVGNNVLSTESVAREFNVELDNVNGFNRTVFQYKMKNGLDTSFSEADYAKGDFELNIAPYFGKSQIKSLKELGKNQFDCILVNGQSINEKYPELASLQNKEEKESKLIQATIYEMGKNDNDISLVTVGRNGNVPKLNEPVKVNVRGKDKEDSVFKQHIAESDAKIAADMQVIKGNVRKNVFGFKTTNSPLYDAIGLAYDEYVNARGSEKTAKMAQLNKACEEYLDKRKGASSADGKARYNLVEKLHNKTIKATKDYVAHSYDEESVSALTDIILVTQGVNGVTLSDPNALHNARSEAVQQAKELLDGYYENGKNKELDKLIEKFSDKLCSLKPEDVRTEVEDAEKAGLKSNLFAKNSAMHNFFAKYVEKNQEVNINKPRCTATLCVTDFDVNYLLAFDKSINNPDKMREMYLQLGFSSKSSRAASQYFNAVMTKMVSDPEASVEKYSDPEYVKNAGDEYLDYIKEFGVFDKYEKIIENIENLDVRLETLAKPYQKAREMVAEISLPDITSKESREKNKKAIDAGAAFVIESSQNEQGLRKLGDRYYNAYGGKDAYAKSTEHMEGAQVLLSIAREVDAKKDPYFFRAAKKAFLDYAIETGQYVPGTKTKDLNKDYFSVSRYNAFYSFFALKTREMPEESLKKYVDEGILPTKDFMEIIGKQFEEVNNLLKGVLKEDKPIVQARPQKEEAINFKELSKEEGPTKERLSSKSESGIGKSKDMEEL